MKSLNYPQNSFANSSSQPDNPSVRIESPNGLFSRCQLDDLFYIDYSSVPNEDAELFVCTSSEEGFYLVYCDQGELEIKLTNGSTALIKAFQSSLIYDKDALGIKLAVQKNGLYHFHVIGCDKPKHQSSDFHASCYERLRNTFCSVVPDNYNRYLGRPDLKLTEKIKTLSILCDKHVPSQLIMWGLMLEVFGLKLEQMLEEINGGWREYGRLTTRDMEEVRNISDYIRKYPSMEFTIEILCRKAGLSPAKLQEGFKKMHNNTVINFIRDVRLEKATELIKASDLNISEIVYSIGLTSRSYFSKIFKNKYHCSPKFFQEQHRVFSRLL